MRSRRPHSGRHSAGASGACPRYGSQAVRGGAWLATRKGFHHGLVATNAARVHARLLPDRENANQSSENDVHDDGSRPRSQTGAAPTFVARDLNRNRHALVATESAQGGPGGITAIRAATS